MTNADGGVMEIVDYNAETGYAYAINGQAGTLAAISLADLEKGETIQQLEGNTVDVKRCLLYTSLSRTQKPGITRSKMFHLMARSARWGIHCWSSIPARRAQVWTWSRTTMDIIC